MKSFGLMPLTQLSDFSSLMGQNLMGKTYHYCPRWIGEVTQIPEDLLQEFIPKYPSGYLHYHHFELTFLPTIRESFLTMIQQMTTRISGEIKYIVLYENTISY
jgi:hypothetical protein